jgi:hypothetical protein
MYDLVSLLQVGPRRQASPGHSGLAPEAGRELLGGVVVGELGEGELRARGVLLLQLLADGVDVLQASGVAAWRT